LHKPALKKPEEKSIIKLVYTNDNLPNGLNINSVLCEAEVAKYFNWKARSLSNYRGYYKDSGGFTRVGPKWIRYGIKTIRYVVKDILRASAGLPWTEPYPEFYKPKVTKNDKK
jgi:hypothetical protein